MEENIYGTLVDLTDENGKPIFNEQFLFEKYIGKKTLKFVNKSNNPDPEYKCDGDSGFDLRAYIEDGKTITLQPMETKMIHTGLYFEIPLHTEIQVRPRSGLALKYSITVTNTPGTCDGPYTGEVCVILTNLGDQWFDINNGDRIAQAVLCPVYDSTLVKLEPTDEIKSFSDRFGKFSENEDRGSGGFGHTGIA